MHVLDLIINVVGKLIELVVVLAILRFVLGFFFDVDVDGVVKRIRRRKASDEQDADHSKKKTRTRVRVEMVRDADGRFVQKKPPVLGDPHTADEIAQAEEEVEAELRRGRR